MKPGDVLAGRYLLEELLGSGGMSSVYRAHDSELERRVALKILHERLCEDPKFVERFRGEARTVAGLLHQNIVTVIDRGDDDGRPFIVFELVPGENLKQLVAREGALPLDRAVELAVQVARGLAFAHEHGYVHRDVKPQNVLLNGDGEAKVTDFGIARALDVQQGGVTQTGTVLGTSDYISPEQAQGRRVGEASDVYSLGVVLYELLSGGPPFAGDNFVAVAMRHINEEPRPVGELRPDAPPRLRAAVARALAKRPEDRFGSMDELGRELEACLVELRGTEGDATAVIPPVPLPPRPSSGPRLRGRRRVPLRAAGLVLALAIVAAGAAAAVALLRGGGGAPGGGSDADGAGGGAAVALRAVSAYDPPPGDGHENNGQLSLATDGKEGTAWSTEHYRYPDGGLGKPGVGIVLAAGSAVALRELTVHSDTPGFTAIVRAGASSSGPFQDVSSSQTVGTVTTFNLDGSAERYYVLWITRLPLSTGPRFHADVNEVTAAD